MMQFLNLPAATLSPELFGRLLVRMFSSKIIG